MDEIHYDETGSTVTESQAGYVDLVFAFTGRFFDKKTGLQNNLNRWYDPTVGRWLSEDPIGFYAGDANLYRYVGNGPVNGTDPSRLVGGMPGFGGGSSNSGGASGGGGGAGFAPPSATCPVTMGPMIDPPPPLFPVGPAPVFAPVEFDEPGLRPSWSPFDFLAGIFPGVGVVIGGGGTTVGGGTAIVAPGLPAGTFPALGYGNTVVVGRAHIICQQMARSAGINGPETYYGMAIIDDAGNFVGWAMGTGPK